MKAYKGFNKDMTCRGFQFEEGKEYEEKKAECCSSGFHACEYPLDVLNYYNPAKSVYHEVEVDGYIDKSEDDMKVAATKIKIGASINLAGLVKAAIEYTKARVDKTKESDEDYGASSAQGQHSALLHGNKQRAVQVQAALLCHRQRQGMVQGTLWSQILRCL